MIETSKQKTQIQAHHMITESATQTHTETNKRLRARDMNCLIVQKIQKNCLVSSTKTTLFP